MIRQQKSFNVIAIVFILCTMLITQGANGESVRWTEYMNLPTQSEISNHSATGRAPYIVCTPSFSGTDGYTDYVVDFRADYLPVGTYLATCNFDIDNRSLLKQYASVSRDYNGVGA